MPTLDQLFNSSMKNNLNKLIDANIKLAKTFEPLVNKDVIEMLKNKMVIQDFDAFKNSYYDNNGLPTGAIYSSRNLASSPIFEIHKLIPSPVDTNNYRDARNIWVNYIPLDMANQDFDAFKSPYLDNKGLPTGAIYNNNNYATDPVLSFNKLTPQLASGNNYKNAIPSQMSSFPSAMANQDFDGVNYPYLDNKGLPTGAINRNITKATSQNPNLTFELNKLIPSILKGNNYKKAMVLFMGSIKGDMDSQDFNAFSSQYLDNKGKPTGAIYDNNNLATDPTQIINKMVPLLTSGNNYKLSDRILQDSIKSYMSNQDFDNFGSPYMVGNKPTGRITSNINEATDPTFILNKLIPTSTPSLGIKDTNNYKTALAMPMGSVLGNAINQDFSSESSYDPINPSGAIHNSYVASREVLASIFKLDPQTSSGNNYRSAIRTFMFSTAVDQIANQDFYYGVSLLTNQHRSDLNQTAVKDNIGDVYNASRGSGDLYKLTPSVISKNLYNNVPPELQQPMSAPFKKHPPQSLSPSSIYGETAQQKQEFEANILSGKYYNKDLVDSFYAVQTKVVSNSLVGEYFSSGASKIEINQNGVARGNEYGPNESFGFGFPNGFGFFDAKAWADTTVLRLREIAHKFTGGDGPASTSTQVGTALSAFALPLLMHLSNPMWGEGQLWNPLSLIGLPPPLGGLMTEHLDGSFGLEPITSGHGINTRTKSSNKDNDWMLQTFNVTSKFGHNRTSGILNDGSVIAQATMDTKFPFLHITAPYSVEKLGADLSRPGIRIGVPETPFIPEPLFAPQAFAESRQREIEVAIPDAELLRLSLQSSVSAQGITRTEKKKLEGKSLWGVYEELNTYSDLKKFIPDGNPNANLQGERKNQFYSEQTFDGKKENVYDDDGHESYTIHKIEKNKIEKVISDCYVPVIITDLRSGNSTVFKPYIKRISQTLSPTWTPNEYIGRVDSIQTYKNTAREMNLDLMFPAVSKKSFEVIWKQISFLETLVYPKHDRSTNQFIAAPVIRIKVGDLISVPGQFIDDSSKSKENVPTMLKWGCPAIITSFSYDYSENYPWQIHSQQLIVPMVLGVNLGIKVFHDYIPGINENDEYYGYSKSGDK